MAPTLANEPPAPSSNEVLAGADLVAWRSLHVRPLADDALTQAYWDFIQTYPSSTLAELAWAELVARGASVPTEDEPALRAYILPLDRSLRSHQATLDRGSPAAIVPVRLNPDGTEFAAPKRARPLAAGFGAGWSAQGALATLGLRLQRGPAVCLLRLGWTGQGALVEGALRIHPTPKLPFGEVGLSSAGALALRGGGALPLTSLLSLEGALGAARTLGSDPTWSPSARLDLVWTL